MAISGVWQWSWWLCSISTLNMEIKSEAVNGCDYSRQHLDHKHQTINKQKLKFGMEEILGNIGTDRVISPSPSPSPCVRNNFISTLLIVFSWNFERIRILFWKKWIFSVVFGVESKSWCVGCDRAGVRVSQPSLSSLVSLSSLSKPDCDIFSASSPPRPFFPPSFLLPGGLAQPPPPPLPPSLSVLGVSPPFLSPPVVSPWYQGQNTQC